MDSCKCCNEHHDKCNKPGTAPDRTKQYHPSMYEHMHCFKTFKEQKELECQIKKAKEKINNEKFTDFVARPNDEITDKTNDINKHLIGLVELKANKLTESTNFQNLIICPVTMCKQNFGITSILSHFLRDHKQHFSIDFQAVNEAQRVVLLFAENVLPFNETVCLGVLAYGGIDSRYASQ